LGACRLIILISFWCISLFISRVSFFISFGQCKLEVLYPREVLLPLPVYGHIGLVDLLPAFHSQPVLVSVDVK
jgi:hypothetical protein